MHVEIIAVFTAVETARGQPVQTGLMLDDQWPLPPVTLIPEGKQP